MKHWKVGSISLLIAVFAIAGCAKKSTEQASITGTGFDSATSTEELAQLPQQSTTNQQNSVEVLPVETSPITQGVPPIAGPTSMLQTTAKDMAAISSLSKEQQIQTALKNAGLYTGAIDGKIGPGSKRAIEEFQKRNGLKADGKVGPKTWAALEPYISGAPVSQSTQSLDQ